MPKNNAPKPWERQENESAKAYEAFAVYRDMGVERSVRATAKALGKSIGLISRWSANYEWVNRVRALDNEQESQDFAERKKDATEARKRQMQIAMRLEKTALEALKNLKPEDLTPKDIKEFLRLATDIESRAISSVEAIDKLEKYGVTAQDTISDDVRSAVERFVADGYDGD